MCKRTESPTRNVCDCDENGRIVNKTKMIALVRGFQKPFTVVSLLVKYREEKNHISFTLPQTQNKKNTIFFSSVFFNPIIKQRPKRDQARRFSRGKDPFNKPKPIG